MREKFFSFWQRKTCDIPLIDIKIDWLAFFLLLYVAAQQTGLLPTLARHPFHVILAFDDLHAAIVGASISASGTYIIRVAARGIPDAGTVV